MLLPIGPAVYLLLGVALAVGFQLLVRRRPLRELWARRGAQKRSRPADVVLTAGHTLVMAASFAVLFPPRKRTRPTCCGPGASWP